MGLQNQLSVFIPTLRYVVLLSLSTLNTAHWLASLLFLSPFCFLLYKQVLFKICFLYQQQLFIMSSTKHTFHLGFFFFTTILLKKYRNKQVWLQIGAKQWQKYVDNLALEEIGGA